MITHRMLAAVLVSGLLSLGWTWPFSRTVTLASADGARSFAYTCGSVTPQMEALDDVTKVLVPAMLKVIEDARKHDRFVSMSEVSSAEERQDFRALERAVVQYECTHGLD